MTGADELQAIVVSTNFMLNAADPEGNIDALNRHICTRQCIEGQSLTRAAALILANSFAVANDLIVLAAQLAGAMALQEVQDPDNRDTMEKIFANMAAAVDPTAEPAPSAGRMTQAEIDQLADENRANDKDER